MLMIMIIAEAEVGGKGKKSETAAEEEGMMFSIKYKNNIITNIP